MKFVCAWLGEDFDAAITQLVVFRRKRILVDANLANGIFRRQLASAESINKNGTAIGTGRGSGQRLEILLQVFWVIRQRLQVVATDHQRTGVVRSFCSHAGSRVVLHGHLLHGRGDLQLKIQRLHAAAQGYFGRLRHREVRRRCQYTVIPRHQTGERVRSITPSGKSLDKAGRPVYFDGGAGNDGATFVGYLPAQSGSLRHYLARSRQQEEN